MRWQDQKKRLEVTFDEEWEVSEESQDLLVVHDREGQGVFQVEIHSVKKGDKLPHLARMLAGFLTYEVEPILADELHKMQLSGGIVYSWSYCKEGEDPDRILGYKVYVGGNEFCWFFANFVTEQENLSHYQEKVDNLVRQIKLSTNILGS